MRLPPQLLAGCTWQVSEVVTIPIAIRARGIASCKVSVQVPDRSVLTINPPIIESLSLAEESWVMCEVDALVTADISEPIWVRVCVEGDGFTQLALFSVRTGTAPRIER